MKSDITDIGMFKLWLETKGLKESSIALYTDSVECFLIKNPDIDNIDDYNNFLVQRVIKKRSNYFYDAIKAFIKFKIEDQSLRNMLIRNLVRPKTKDPKKTTIYLSREKRKEVISYFEDEKHRIIAIIQFHTGARVNDILKITRGNINFENYNGKLAMKIDIIGKGGKRIPKYIFDQKAQEDILSFIQEHYLDDYYYFVDFSKSWQKTSEYVVIRTNYHWYWAELKKALKKANVNPKDWATHDFRRNIARDIWTDPDMGKDVQLLQNYLGHNNPATTLRYLRTSGLSNAEVSKRLDEKFS